MQRHFYTLVRSRFVLLALTLGFAAILFLVGGTGLPHAKAQSPVEFDPLLSPSAAGEMYLLRQEGQLPPALPGPQAPSKVPRGVRLPGTDVIANNPADDTPERTTQSETSLAVNGNTLCAGYNNSGPGGFSGLSRSTNLGAAWTDLGGIGQSGDPILAVHNATGTFYYAEIATISGKPAIGVARSTDDCQTFGAPVNASPGASAIATTTLNDKPWVAVDNTGGANDGNLYVCWTRFDSAPGSELRFSRSTDGGVTYGNEQILTPNGTGPFGCSVGVGPNGEVYVSWADRAGATSNDIRFRRSTDGGITFNAAISLATGNRHPGIDTIVTCGSGTRPTLTGNIRMLHQSWLAVDTTGGPFNGNIYVVWASDPVGTPDNSNAFFSRSTDGGLTWSAAVQLGAGGGATDQFEPFVTVGGTGVVAVAWYDRRNDTANNTLIDVFTAFSRDGGVTMDPIVRVTDVNFPVPPINPNFDPGVVTCYMGEYIGMAADNNKVYYLWGDNRNTLVTTAFPSGRPDPDVFFDSQAMPGLDSDVSITKADNPDPVVAGTDLTYLITATNNGPGDAQDVAIADIIPANTTFQSATPSAGSSCSLPPVGGTGNVSCTWAGTTTSGSSRTLTLIVHVNSSTPDGSTITNTATTSTTTNDPNSGNNSDTETTDVITRADLQSFKTHDVTGYAGAGQVTWHATVTNSGPSDAQTVVMTDALDVTQTSYVSATPDGGGNCTFVSPTVTCTWTAVAAGASVHVDIIADLLPNALHLCNTASASSATTDPNPANNSASDCFTVPTLADVSIVKVAQVVATGRVIRYTLTVHNAGPSYAQNVRVVDKLADSTTFESVTTTQGTCSGKVKVVCKLGVLTFKDVIIIIQVNVNTSVTGVDNTAAARSVAGVDPATPDPHKKNNKSEIHVALGGN